MAWHLRVGRLVFKTETKKDPQVNVKESSKTEDETPIYICSKCLM